MMMLYKNVAKVTLKWLKSKLIVQLPPNRSLDGLLVILDESDCCLLIFHSLVGRL